MSILTIQPSDIDALIQQSGPNTNSGANAYLLIYPNVDDIIRSILKFDFSALPAGAIISAATLSLYFIGNFVNSPDGRTYWAYELTQTGWVELEATWNSYKTGSVWAAAGGDYITDNGASVVMPTQGHWVDWNVLALVQHFQSAHAKIAHFLIRDGTEGVEVQKGAYLCSNNYTTDPTLCPKLVITYTLAGGSDFFQLF